MAIDYTIGFTNQDGVAYPDTAGKNATGPSAIDGTEFVKIFVDDIWGRFQAILDYAGLTPTGVTESASVSQHIEAIKKGFAIGPGMGVTYWKDGDPLTNGDRVLLLNGQGITRSNYIDLDNAVYVGDGNNPTASAFYRADDAAGVTRNTTGIYLILPETRGYVLRGLDAAASIDPDGASRDLGSAQLDSMQGHKQKIGYSQSAGYGGSLILAGVGGSDSGYIPDAGYNANSGFESNETRDFITDGTNGTPRIDIESRMINIATRYGITY